MAGLCSGMAATMNVLMMVVVFNSISFFLAKGASSTKGESCIRFEKLKKIGYDYEREDTVQVDVGECKAGPSEVNGTNCIPRHVTEERRVLFGDHRVTETETIQSCQRESSTCQRQPRFVSFYPGTAYSKIIDMGVCGGQCKASKACKPVSTKAKAIPTPNGDRCIPVIKTCSCVNCYCYRVTDFERFSLYPDGKGTSRTKEIDMGKCVSERMCPMSQASITSSEPPFLFKRCTPGTYEYFSFVSSGGRHMNISAIASCTCQP